MHFAPDTENTLDFVVALGNTHPTASRSGRDELATPAELTALLLQHSYSGRMERDEVELREVRGTRDLLRRVWTMHRDDAAVAVNRMLREANALPYLMRHDHFDWHLHATDLEAPLAERIRVEAALAIVDVIRTDETDRMRECAADDCTGLLVDLSRNGSKRFCSVRCGNRMNQLAYRERVAR
ncbi:MAG: CGNR zinc finger domain-containing protein [Rhodoglobus sp.]|nr:CGNR zinc finger domain-containing protein [Rhodoglobus sp.]